MCGLGLDAEGIPQRPRVVRVGTAERSAATSALVGGGFNMARVGVDCSESGAICTCSRYLRGLVAQA